MRERAAYPPVFDVERTMSGRDVVMVEAEFAEQAALTELLGTPAHPDVRHAVRALLWPDPSSGYDTLAVAVWIAGRHVGWLDHAASARLVRLVRTLAMVGEVCACGAFIVAAPAPDGSERLTVELLLDIESIAARVRAIEVSGGAAERRSSGRVAS